MKTRFPKYMQAITAVSAAFATTFVFTSTASAADVFHYQDRTGRVHVIDVTTTGSVAAVGANAATERPAMQPRRSSKPSSIEMVSNAVPDIFDTNQSFVTTEVTPLRSGGARTAALRTPAMPTLETNAAAIPYMSLVQEAASMFALPPELILAVMKVESNFNPRALSKKGAMGLMQLMPTTAASLGVTDPYDPRQNIMGGARYLRTLVNDFDGEVSLALAGYNAGAGAVRRSGGVPGNAETQGYVPLVMAIYKAYAASGIARSAGM
ncbi:MAG: lytic transglycosylase domain-containing protein [Polyangiaceae bacterium]